MKKVLLTLLFPLICGADDAADEIMRQHIELLRSINNKEQADAAAQQVDDFETPETAKEALYDDLQNEYEKLDRAYYYGSEKMALAMEADAEDAILPTPLTPEIQAELEERIRRSFALLPPSRRAGVNGGPGLSRETAWVCKAPRPHTPPNCDEELYFAPHALIGGRDASIKHQEEQRIDGKLYLITTVALYHRGLRHEITVWADVSACPVFQCENESEKEAPYAISTKEEGDAHLARVQQRKAILQSVQNRASADAAADYLTDLMSPAHDISFTEYYAELATPTQNEYTQLVDHAEQNYYYGSTLLAEYYGNKFTAYRPTPLTPEVAAEIENRARESIRQATNPLHRAILGGPGFTRETAWRIPAAVCIDGIKKRDRDNNNALLTLEKVLIYPSGESDFELGNIEEGVIDGKLYECLQVKELYQGRLYSYSVWLDYSEGRHIPTDAEYRKAYSDYLHALSAQLKLLRNVQDRTTADAAAAQLTTIPLPRLPQHELWQTANTPHPYLATEKELEAVKQMLRNQQCYQSRALLMQICYAKSDAFTPAERRQMNKDWEQKVRGYTELLHHILPQVTDHASAMAAARTLRDKGIRLTSHINLLRDGNSTNEETLRHLHRIRKADYFYSVDLANILEERCGPSGHPSQIPEYDEADISANEQAMHEAEQIMRRNLSAEN